MSFVHFLLDLVGLAGTRSGDHGEVIRLGAYAYGDSLGHGFARNVVVEVGLLVAGVIGLVGTASGFIQEVVSGFKEGQKK